MCGDLLTPILVAIFNQIFCQGEALTSSQCTAVISLLPKVNRPQSLNDFRPIALLNADYKIFTRVLKSRFTESLEFTLSVTQYAVSKNRNILDASVLLRDIFLAPSPPSEDFLAILPVDFTKAFDYIRIEYILYILKKMAFPLIFLQAVQNLYNEAKACVRVGSKTSHEFLIKNSVRQGCPLSMALFAVAMDPLTRALEAAGVGISRQGIT